MTSNNNTDKSTTIERIYMGGLDPPRLTAQEVLDRFAQLNKTKCQVEFLSLESYEGKPYCHITATFQSPAEGESHQSALSVLHATFNNVKWRGCRLVVEAARPHFLQLLEQERKEHSQVSGGGGDDMDNHHHTVQEPKQPHIPRRLRIRKKFGDEAYHVDTKPWSVDDWSGFSRAVGKQKKRVEKHVEEMKRRKELPKMPSPLMHRAIHIRFGESAMQRQGTTNGLVGSDDDDDDRLSPELAETSDDSSTGSSTSEGIRDDAREKEEVNNGARTNRESYTWSDDDDDDDDEKTSKSESSEQVAPETELAAQAVEKDASSLPSSENQSGGEEELNVFPQESRHVKPGPALDRRVEDAALPPTNQPYQWSSDEDSSDGGREESTMRKRPLIPTTESDEFAAGLDLDDDKEQSDDENDSTAPPTKSVTLMEMDGDLENDVTANLNILSSLFPEVADAQPAYQGPDNNKELGKEEQAKQTQTGFGASGIMLRFDPKDASTQKFEISKVEQEQNDEGVGGKDETEPSEDQDHDKPGLQKNPTNEPEPTAVEQPVLVFEQKKLENVFKEARDAWKGSQVVEKAVNVGGATGGGFSFGFDLGPPRPLDGVQTQPTAGFSFGFDLPKTTDTSTKRITDEEAKGQVPEAVSDALELTAKAPERRIRGFLLPDDVLEQYKTSFYAANKGVEIIKDVDAFRNDADAKEAWNKERHTLTQDWKRKRKHAQSRIQKRIKIR